jgi:hypothetical protein
MKNKILERMNNIKDCLGTEFKISELLNFTSKFWENIRYQNGIDQIGKYLIKNNPRKKTQRREKESREADSKKERDIEKTVRRKEESR